MFICDKMYLAVIISFLQQTEDNILQALFKVELCLQPNALLFDPNVDDYRNGISEVISNFQDTVLSVENLVSDSYFDAFTRYCAYETST